MFRRIICVTAVVVLLLMCSYGYCHDPKHLNEVKKELRNRSLLLGPIRFPKALELSTAHEGDFQLSSKWKTMRIRSSSRTIGFNNYVCPPAKIYYNDWSYNLKQSWNYCGNYCDTYTHTNYVTQEKKHKLQNEIIPAVFKKLLEEAPLIRHVPTNLVFYRPTDLTHICGYIKADESHYALGLPNTDLVVHFSLSLFLYQEVKSLAWSLTCDHYEGRISSLVINVNPCWVTEKVDETIDAAVQLIQKALRIENCPKNSILLHVAKEWYNNVIVCVEVKCKNDKTYEVRFKDANWIPCHSHHVLGSKEKTELYCPPFEEVCEEAEKKPAGESVTPPQRVIETPVIEDVKLIEVANTANASGADNTNGGGGNTGDGAAMTTPPLSDFNVSISEKALLEDMIRASQGLKDSSAAKTPYSKIITLICVFLFAAII